MATLKQRGVLIDQLTKLGLPETVRQGYLDVLIDGMADNPDTPAELLARVGEVESVAETHTVEIGGIKNTITTINGQFADINAIGQRQDAAIAVQNQEIVRLNDEITTNSRDHLEFRAEFLEIKSAADNTAKDITDLTVRVSANETNNTQQESRITFLEELTTGTGPGSIKELETKVDTKADLVGGKIPMSQLPELPTGRKIAVANTAARLELEVHTDITIAYQQDDGVAYILGAGDNPAEAAKWQPLSSTQGSGITAWNGRTGVVTPQAGDYTSNMITTTSDNRFVRDVDISRWDAKATTSEVIASTSSLRTEVAQKYVPLTTNDFIRVDTRGKANGTPTLNSQGIVPTNQLPPLGLSASEQSRLQAVESLARLADLKGDSAATNIKALDDNRIADRQDAVQRLTTLESQRSTDRALINANTSKNTAQDARLEALEANVGVDAIPVSEKGSPSGVAPLGTDSKIPVQYLPFTPSTARKWTDVKASRTIATWNKNTSLNEMTVYINSVTGTVANRQIIAQIRVTGQTAPIITFKSDLIGVTVDKTVSLTFTVPSGSEYYIANTGGTTIQNTDTWAELV